MDIKNFAAAVYVFDDTDKLKNHFPARCESYLSEQRREKVNALRFAEDKKLSAAAYMLLRAALKERRGIDEPVVFSFRENGKPFLRDYPNIFFNLSHCREAAACALSCCEIGVDVQGVAPVTDSLAKRVLTGEEYALFKCSPNPELLFCEYWTAKESYLKQTGQGLNMNPGGLAVSGLKGLTAFGRAGRYCGCVSESVPQAAEIPIIRVPLIEYIK